MIDKLEMKVNSNFYDEKQSIVRLLIFSLVSLVPIQQSNQKLNKQLITVAIKNQTKIKSNYNQLKRIQITCYTKMSTRQFISSAQHPHIKQLMKFQLPHQKHSDYVPNQQTRGNQKKSSQNKVQRLIYDKIAEVQKENQKLLNISSQLNRSSMSFSYSEQLSALIYPIQEQMKSAFNQLIQSIQEFYIDIDHKIKEIGSYLATLSGVDTLQTSKKDHDQVLFSSNHHHHTNHQHQQQKQNQKQKPFSLTNEQQTIRSINMKIELMQKDLQQTKSNQHKLMTIIQKLVEKYQLTNETTMVRDDPFLKKKVQAIGSRVEASTHQRDNLSPQSFREHNSHQSKQRFIEANTFSKPNYAQNQVLPQNINSVRGPPPTSNQTKISQNPQRNVFTHQNPNDYSIYQELNKIQENNHTLQNQRSFLTSNLSQPKDMFFKNKQKPKLVAQKLDASMMSVNSYAYSNSMDEQEEDQCFIKKLYSKQAPSFNKVSLKSCNNPNKTVFLLNRPQEQTPIQNSNKNHRQAYLMNQLKRFN